MNLLTENIGYHARNGIDKFIITLHNCEIDEYKLTKELSKISQVKIFLDKSAVFNPATMRIRMIEKVKQDYKNSWVINNDADELWVTDGVSLKSVFHEAEDTGNNLLFVDRYNMVPYTMPSESYISPFDSFKYGIVKTTNFEKSLNFSSIDPLTFACKFNNGKCAGKAEDIISIDRGSHYLDVEKRRVSNTKKVKILHYPYTNPGDLDLYVYSKLNGPDNISDTKISWHIKYLAYMLENNREDLVSKLFPNSNLISLLLEAKTIEMLNI